MNNENYFDVCVVTTIHPENEKRIYSRGALVYSEFGYRTAIIAPWKNLHPSSSIKLYGTTFPSRRVQRIQHGYATFKLALSINAKIYHIHDIDFLPWSAILKYIKKCNIIYDCHENYPEEVLHNKKWIPLPIRGLLSGIVRYAENSLAKYVKNVIAVVPYQVERFTKIGCCVTLVRNFSAIESNNFSAERESKSKISNAGSTVGVAYFGSISKNYGLDTLIDLIYSCYNMAIPVHFYIGAKFTEPEARFKLQKAISECPSLVTMIENANQPQMLTMAQDCSIGLSFEIKSPEKSIAYPAKLFEYMKYGFAIIASDTKTNEVIIGESKSGFVCDHRNANEYLDKIKYLINNRRIMEEYMNNSTLASESIFSWETEKVKLHTNAKRILEGGNSDE